MILSDEIVSFKTSKPVPYYLKRWHLPTPCYRNMRLAYTGDDCPCLLHIGSIIGLLHRIS